MDEKDLIHSARKGDLEAFNNLGLVYQDRVYNLAYYMLLDAQAADNTTQKAFISAFQKIRQFRDGSFQVWLLRIVVSLCYEEIRRENFPTAGPLGRLNPDLNEIEAPYRLADPGESIKETIKQAEYWEDLLRCLNRMPPMYRIAVILVDVQQLDYVEAAAVMGVPKGVLKCFLSFGRVRILQGYYQSLQRAKCHETYLRITNI